MWCAKRTLTSMCCSRSSLYPHHYQSWLLKDLDGKGKGSVRDRHIRNTPGVFSIIPTLLIKTSRTFPPTLPSNPSLNVLYSLLHTILFRDIDLDEDDSSILFCDTLEFRSLLESEDEGSIDLRIGKGGELGDEAEVETAGSRL